MSGYDLRVTIACPEMMVSDANALALVLGESPEDIKTFDKAAKWGDDLGNKYVVASTLARKTFPNTASSELKPPSYAPDADMEAASRAQANLVVWVGEGEAPKASPDKLAAMIYPDPMEAISLMGIFIPEETVEELPEEFPEE